MFEEFGDLSELPPERRIIAATLTCIEESGMDSVTVRRIAERAGLNPAAVNYYFRSKDRLIEQALREAWTHVEKDFELIMKEAKSPRELFDTTARYLFEGAIRSPKVIRALVAEHPTLHREAAGFIKTIFARMIERSGTGENAKLGLLFFVSYTFFLGFAPDAVKVLSGVDLSDPQAREEFWDKLSQYLFKRE